MSTFQLSDPIFEKEYTSLFKLLTEDFVTDPVIIKCFQNKLLILKNFPIPQEKYNEIFNFITHNDITSIINENLTDSPQYHTIFGGISNRQREYECKFWHEISFIKVLKIYFKNNENLLRYIGMKVVFVENDNARFPFRLPSRLS
jgi:hypothetical protein